MVIDTATQTDTVGIMSVMIIVDAIPDIGEEIRIGVIDHMDSGLTSVFTPDSDITIITRAGVT